MQEKKGGDMATTKSPKKTNLLDHSSIKHILDESVTEIVKSRGFIEDVRLSNVRLFVGTIIIAIALVAQFYRKKFPENRNFLIGCIILYPFSMTFVLLSSSTYIVFNGILQLIIHTKEKNAIMFTHPPAVSCTWILVEIFFGLGSFTTTGLVVSSKLPRFSDMYTLTIASADPKSVSAKPPVEFTKSVTQWSLSLSLSLSQWLLLFTKEGVLVEGLFWKDVEGLIKDYDKEAKKNK
ncbi:hypothetical protein RHSIM_Rhsim13G0104300 [Rhododendron simsii]|uniref:Signal peptidase complex subunit 2 n=1 Tax=Rhododendron simsii TaxID=118357 RepID=A0A834FXB5_RHOSS|nr:hypothetical protein RHSIM_Rhsim13G0104300 [Rhododendron simsii]